MLFILLPDHRNDFGPSAPGEPADVIEVSAVLIIVYMCQTSKLFKRMVETNTSSFISRPH